MTGTILERAIKLQAEADDLMKRGKEIKLPKGLYKEIKREKKLLDQLVKDMKKKVAGR